MDERAQQPLHPAVRIGHVHLKVADLQRSLRFYHEVLDFQITQRLGSQAVFRRLERAGIPLDGAADHGVSEALYLHDPDGNGVELYWDRPEAEWPRTASGELTMFTQRLDRNAVRAA